MHKATRFTTFVFVLFLAGIALAQTGTISGTVLDKSGAVIPAAKVSATDLATGTSRSVETSATGAFTIPNLAPTVYEVKAEKAGFGAVKYEKLTLHVAQVLSLTVKMNVGAQTEAIEVNGGQVAPIETGTSELSYVIDSRTISDLPLITRNPYELVLLSPGTNQSNSGLGGFSVNGARERNNNFLLDGVDNNDTSVPGIPGGVGSSTPDSAQEFRIITNNFSSEFGRNNGGIVDVVTKAGTNALHGSAYWYGRNDAFTARDYFNHNIDPITGKTEQKNPFVRHQYGFAVSGPIKKDKTFYFVNGEFNHFLTTLTNVSIVPTAAAKTGVFNFTDSNGFTQPIDLRPGSPNNIIATLFAGAPPMVEDPTSAKVFALMPDPNGPSVDSIRGKYFFPSSSITDSQNWTGKLNHRFNDKYSVSGRYIYGHSKDPNPFHLDTLPGLETIGTDQANHNVQGSFAASFTPSLTNEARFGWNQLNDTFNCGGTSTFDAINGVDSLGVGADFDTPNLLDGSGLGCQQLGSTNQQFRNTGTTQIADTMTWAKGRHTMRFGGEYRRVREDGFDDFVSRENYAYNIMQSFGFPAIAAGPDTFTETVLQDFAWTYYGGLLQANQQQFFDKSGTRNRHSAGTYYQHEYGMFFQDDWKVTSNFTFNLGLRYEFYGVPYEAKNNLSNFYGDPTGVAPFTFSLAGPGTGHQLYNDEYTNWEPRVGFSWDPFKDGKTAIRGGVGIFHDRIFGNLVSNMKANLPFQQSYLYQPFFISDLYNNFVSNIGGPVQQPVTSTVQPGANFSANLIDPNLRTPASTNWNIGVQRDLGRNFVLEVNYSASMSRNGILSMNPNPPNPGLLKQLEDYCSVPNAFGCDQSTLQFNNLYLGAEFGVLPFDAVNNNAFATNAGITRSLVTGNYQSMQVNFTKRMSRGLQFHTAYTWSHSIDDANDPLVAAAGNRNFPRDSNNLKADEGNSDFDIRHRIVVDYIYELPFGHGRQWLANGVIGKALEGWQIAGLTAYQSGHPYDIFGNVDSGHTGVSSRPDLIGSPNIPKGADHTQTGPSVTAFDFAPFGRLGNVGRNNFYGPMFDNWDFIIAKKTSISERFKIETRVEMYNLFNQTNFGQPGNLIQNPDSFGTSASQIGRSDGTTGSRQFQLGLKLTF